MAAANAQAITLNDYDYIDEDSIDCELKCSLCMQPFQVLVSATCGHTFCHVCISQWVARQSTCPTCRMRTSTEDFRPISTRIVLNQLERLLMKCKRCNKMNIQRGNIHEHQQRCPNQIVSCPAFNIKCSWNGTRNALTEHIQQCSFQKIRPVIDDIYEHLKNVDYTQLVVYHGVTLTDEMIKDYQQVVGSVLFWFAFTSTLKDRQTAEEFGNTLFIIKINQFLVEKIERDPISGKYLIYMGCD
ncbi:unnamed protein product [Adineta steineri]|uniref:RING-type domain-containing protein n=1 Tax=Adineta steineri TaxID=433720 RepID=A0A819W9B3_9BILA|nr:unnamed protein product [Adineta steineri]CAF4120610.1 unnamed protein product [Adineta steineri]